MQPEAGGNGAKAGTETTPKINQGKARDRGSIAEARDDCAGRGGSVRRHIPGDREVARFYRNGQLGNAPAPAMMAVHIAEEVKPKKRSRGSNLQRNQAGAIHIEFARARVSIEGGADAAMVRAVLESLAG